MSHVDPPDIVSWLFVVSNGGRILAYLPQIAAAWRCPAGARSVSLVTWSYFAFAHATALLYAILVLNDLRATWIFVGNFAVTAFLVAVLLWKRRPRPIPAPPLPAPTERNTDMRTRLVLLVAAAIALLAFASQREATTGTDMTRKEPVDAEPVPKATTSRDNVQGLRSSDRRYRIFD